ncbi:MAG: hypothetical protein K2W82_07025 [Candidatus Obscuribacterales bacterium]|nr:hypothetical protein [Candidatus Obscuribacterales bacterium]
MSFRFQSRLVVSGYLNCRSGARISAAGDNRINTAELYAMRDLSGLPYIPGSNFKGLLRKHVESYLRESLGSHGACNHYNKETACIRLGEPNSDASVYLRELIETTKGNEEELKKAIELNSCLACALFGSQFLESHVSIEDLRPLNWSGQFRLGKQEREPLSINPGHQFMFRAILDNCEAWKRALFIVGLSHLQSRLITVATGKSQDQLVATVENVSMQSLESALELLQCLDNFKATDGNPVTLEQQQRWMNDLRRQLSGEQIAVAC